jgi:hypothetical protein
MDELVRLRYLIEDMPEARDAWRTFGIRLAAISGAFALSVWLTVRRHPEQDLPLWPAWIFAAITCVGVVLAVVTVFELPPFRARRRRRD